MSEKVTSKKFVWSEEKEPHFLRRKQILKAHPEVRELFTKDPLLLLKIGLPVALQLGTAVWISQYAWWWMVLVAFTIGSTLSHVLFLGIHELSHDLAFEKKPLNNWLAILANFPIVVPYAMAFKTYHLEHHWNQGKDGVDTDLPSDKEALIFRGFFGKMIWMINQILFYALRPMLVKPIKPTSWHIINFIVQIVFLATFIWFFGMLPILYLLLGVFFSGGLHPISGHFIAEHYVFEEGQETYSYYGFWNKITFNVGYHNEHHDFPNVPGANLPLLKNKAPEHYDSLKVHKSWSGVLVQFIKNESVTLYSRVKRT